MAAVLTILGLILGSFYNVCIYRIGEKASIVFPPSYCPKCKHPLKPRDLIPVLSYILLRGRCRYCKEKISIRYPLVEIITSIIILLLYSKYGLTGRFLTYTILGSILIIISFIDIDKQIIPDILVVIGIGTGLFVCLLGFTVSLADALLGLLLGAGILLTIGLISLLILKKEGMGGGDIKLMGMIGLFLGWKKTLLAIVISIYLGGIVSLFLIVFKKKELGQAIPFGPFISLASLIALVWGTPIISWYSAYFIGA